MNAAKSFEFHGALARRPCGRSEIGTALNGFTRIKLRVAEDNKRAKHVYDVSGFRVTGVNLSKAIGTRE